MNLPCKKRAFPIKQCTLISMHFWEYVVVIGDNLNNSWHCFQYIVPVCNSFHTIKVLEQSEIGYLSILKQNLNTSGCVMFAFVRKENTKQHHYIIRKYLK
jgi:hypothetical protein